MFVIFTIVWSKKISNDQELIQSDPTSCPQNQKGNNSTLVWVSSMQKMFNRKYTGYRNHVLFN